MKSVHTYMQTYNIEWVSRTCECITSVNTAVTIRISLFIVCQLCMYVPTMHW